MYNPEVDVSLSRLICKQRVNKWSQDYRNKTKTKEKGKKNTLWKIARRGMEKRDRKLWPGANDRK